MRKTAILLAAILAAGYPSFVQAQPQDAAAPQTTPAQPPAQSLAFPAEARWFAGFNGGAQVGSNDFTRSVDFELYSEPAQFNSDQTVGGGGFLDVSGAGRLTKSFGAGVAYTRYTSSGGATFDGSLPHPLEFDAPRAFSGTADELEHKEQAVHLQAVWFIPFTDKVDFQISGGPSFFTVDQQVLRGITFSENPPDFNVVTIDTVEIVPVKESGVGFHVGADMIYAITRQLGAGVMLRFSRGSLTLDLGEGQSVDMDAGGFQFGAGVRARF